MEKNQLASLIKMLDQIAANHGHYKESEEAQTVIAAHLKRFWARSMKRQIIDYVNGGGDALSPMARGAVLKLAQDYDGDKASK